MKPSPSPLWRHSPRNPHLSDHFMGGANELIFWTFRYFLGRSTIAGCVFAADLAKAWSLLDENTRLQIAKELSEAFRRDDEARENPAIPPNAYPLGHDCDRAMWERVWAKYSFPDTTSR